MVRRPARPNSEATVHSRTVRFLKREHPGVAFRTDFAAGAKLTRIQAAINKSLQWRSSGWPDLQILKERPMNPGAQVHYPGCFIEIKKDGEKVLRAGNGLWMSEHLAQQDRVITELRDRGYFAVMAIGYDVICAVIDYYLKPELGVKLVYDENYKNLVVGFTRPREEGPQF